ncbi:MAG: helix-turn-helix transcriptional regulator [Ruminococcaceae bacterium]|nr:helix-turn-helix transcriptional regulator [Oscillospiraceae bacterium]
MKENNICKFVAPGAQLGEMTVSCFVFESDPKVIRKKITLYYNRIILFTRGEGKIFFDGVAFDFSAGTLVFGFRNEKLAIEFNDDCKYIYIDFGGERSNSLFERFNIDRYTRIFNGLDGIIPLWKESLSRASNLTIDLAAESILLYTFSRLYESCIPKKDIISDIIKISEKHFNDPTLSVSMIADELCYNPKYISHIFKRKMGINYSEYLKSLRIKYAVSLFENGIDSVKNVALLSGFTDPLYFSSVFKKSLGLSPKEYIYSLGTEK